MRKQDERTRRKKNEREMEAREYEWESGEVKRETGVGRDSFFSSSSSNLFPFLTLIYIFPWHRIAFSIWKEFEYTRQRRKIYLVKLL